MFWKHLVLRGVGGEGSRKYSALEGYGDPYWPIHFSFLAWRTPLAEKPGRPQSTESQAGHDQSNPVHIDTRCSFACGSSAPVDVEGEGGTAASLVGTLAGQGVQGHGLPLPQELWPYQGPF